MKALLDTHAFIWWDSDPTKLSTQARAVCEDRTNAIFLSAASAWEMQIKLQLGKLSLRLSLEEVIASQQQTNNIQILPVALGHVLALKDLPSPHKDPFDRLLIAQANVEDVVLISHDPIFASYPVRVLW
ncbi:MAG TPA: type II toxin-antitoxin system VapC family toxin [Thermoanaerobaculia bacterium]|nr:type II toxin-antitoxin system VapC family toxin [Thermoanaerobaculia bacterium]